MCFIPRHVRLRSLALRLRKRALPNKQSPCLRLGVKHKDYLVHFAKGCLEQKATEDRYLLLR